MAERCLYYKCYRDVEENYSYFCNECKRNFSSLMLNKYAWLYDYSVDERFGFDTYEEALADAEKNKNGNKVGPLIRKVVRGTQRLKNWNNFSGSALASLRSASDCLLEFNISITDEANKELTDLVVGWLEKNVPSNVCVAFEEVERDENEKLARD